MPLIDSEQIKSTLEAWQSTATAIVSATQAADAAFLRGDAVQAEEFHQKALSALRDRHDKAENVAKLIEALIWQAEQDSKAG